MELQSARDTFIHTWGTLATQWGINRTMSQIHALLLLSPTALNADQIMEQLLISRGNANMNLRELMSWGLISKQLVAGERKEYFMAEKDIWKVARLIARERRRREIEPILDTMQQLKSKVQPNSPEEIQLLALVDDIQQVTQFADSVMGTILQADEHWLVNNLMKAMSR